MRTDGKRPDSPELKRAPRLQVGVPLPGDRGYVIDHVVPLKRVGGCAGERAVAAYPKCEG